MNSMKKVGEELGLSRHQVRHRMDLLKPLLGERLKKLEDGRLGLTDEGLAMFRRFMKLEASGMSWAEALNLAEKTFAGTTGRAAASNADGVAKREQMDHSVRLLKRINELEEKLAQKVHELNQLRERQSSSNESVEGRSNFLHKLKGLVAKH